MYHLEEFCKHIEKCASDVRETVPDDMTTKEIYNLALRGDEIAIETFKTTSEVLGRSLANLILILDPEAIFCLEE